MPSTRRKQVGKKGGGSCKKSAGNVENRNKSRRSNVDNRSLAKKKEKVEDDTLVSVESSGNMRKLRSRSLSGNSEYLLESEDTDSSNESHSVSDVESLCEYVKNRNGRKSRNSRCRWKRIDPKYFSSSDDSSTESEVEPPKQGRTPVNVRNSRKTNNSPRVSRAILRIEDSESHVSSNSEQECPIRQSCVETDSINDTSASEEETVVHSTGVECELASPRSRRSTNVSKKGDTKKTPKLFRACSVSKTVKEIETDASTLSSDDHLPRGVSPRSKCEITEKALLKTKGQTVPKKLKCDSSAVSVTDDDKCVSGYKRERKNSSEKIPAQSVIDGSDQFFRQGSSHKVENLSPAAKADGSTRQENHASDENKSKASNRKRKQKYAKEKCSKRLKIQENSVTVDSDSDVTRHEELEETKCVNEDKYLLDIATPQLTTQQILNLNHVSPQMNGALQTNLENSSEVIASNEVTLFDMQKFFAMLNSDATTFSRDDLMSLMSGNSRAINSEVPKGHMESVNVESLKESVSLELSSEHSCKSKSQQDVCSLQERPTSSEDLEDPTYPKSSSKSRDHEKHSLPNTHGAERRSETKCTRNNKESHSHKSSVKHKSSAKSKGHSESVSSRKESSEEQNFEEESKHSSKKKHHSPAEANIAHNNSNPKNKTEGNLDGTNTKSTASTVKGQDSLLKSDTCKKHIQHTSQKNSKSISKKSHSSGENVDVEKIDESSQESYKKMVDEKRSKKKADPESSKKVVDKDNSKNIKTVCSENIEVTKTKSPTRSDRTETSEVGKKKDGKRDSKESWSRRRKERDDKKRRKSEFSSDRYSEKGSTEKTAATRDSYTSSLDAGSPAGKTLVPSHVEHSHISVVPLEAQHGNGTELNNSKDLNSVMRVAAHNVHKSPAKSVKMIASDESTGLSIPNIQITLSPKLSSPRGVCNQDNLKQTVPEATVRLIRLSPLEINKWKQKEVYDINQDFTKNRDEIDASTDPPEEDSTVCDNVSLPLASESSNIKVKSNKSAKTNQQYNRDADEYSHNCSRKMSLASSISSLKESLFEESLNTDYSSKKEANKTMSTRKDKSKRTKHSSGSKHSNRDSSVDSLFGNTNASEFCNERKLENGTVKYKHVADSNKNLNEKNSCRSNNESLSQDIELKMPLASSISSLNESSFEDSLNTDHSSKKEVSKSTSSKKDKSKRTKHTSGSKHSSGDSSLDSLIGNTNSRGFCDERKPKGGTVKNKCIVDSSKSLNEKSNCSKNLASDNALKVYKIPTKVHKDSATSTGVQKVTLAKLDNLEAGSSRQIVNTRIDNRKALLIGKAKRNLSDGFDIVPNLTNSVLPETRKKLCRPVTSTPINADLHKLMTGKPFVDDSSQNISPFRIHNESTISSVEIKASDNTGEGTLPSTPSKSANTSPNKSDAERSPGSGVPPKKRLKFVSLNVVNSEAGKGTNAQESNTSVVKDFIRPQTRKPEKTCAANPILNVVTTSSSKEFPSTVNCMKDPRSCFQKNSLINGVTSVKDRNLKKLPFPPTSSSHVESLSTNAKRKICVEGIEPLPPTQRKGTETVKPNYNMFLQRNTQVEISPKDSSVLKLNAVANSSASPHSSNNFVTCTASTRSKTPEENKSESVSSAEEEKTKSTSKTVGRFRSNFHTRIGFPSSEPINKQQGSPHGRSRKSEETNFAGEINCHDLRDKLDRKRNNRSETSVANYNQFSSQSSSGQPLRLEESTQSSYSPRRREGSFQITQHNIENNPDDDASMEFSDSEVRDMSASNSCKDTNSDTFEDYSDEDDILELDAGTESLYADDCDAPSITLSHNINFSRNSYLTFGQNPPQPHTSDMMLNQKDQTQNSLDSFQNQTDFSGEEEIPLSHVQHTSTIPENRRESPVTHNVSEEPLDYEADTSAEVDDDCEEREEEEEVDMEFCSHDEVQENNIAEDNLEDTTSTRVAIMESQCKPTSSVHEQSDGSSKSNHGSSTHVEQPGSPVPTSREEISTETTKVLSSPTNKTRIKYTSEKKVASNVPPVHERNYIFNVNEYCLKFLKCGDPCSVAGCNLLHELPINLQERILHENPRKILNLVAFLARKHYTDFILKIVMEYCCEKFVAERNSAALEALLEILHRNHVKYSLTWEIIIRAIIRCPIRNDDLIFHTFIYLVNIGAFKTNLYDFVNLSLDLQNEECKWDILIKVAREQGYFPPDVLRKVMQNAVQERRCLKQVHCLFRNVPPATRKDIDMSLVKTFVQCLADAGYNDFVNADAYMEVTNVQRNNFIPSAMNDIAPQMNNMVPRMNNTPPQVNNIVPRMNNMPPQANNIVPRMNNMPPQANNIVPQMNNMPPQANIVPRMNNMPPQVNNVVPRMNNMPPQANIVPRMNNMPQQANNIVPWVNSMPPRMNIMPPQMNRIPPPINKITPPSNTLPLPYKQPPPLMSKSISELFVPQAMNTPEMPFRAERSFTYETDNVFKCPAPVPLRHPKPYNQQVHRDFKRTRSLPVTLEELSKDISFTIQQHQFAKTVNAIEKVRRRPEIVCKLASIIHEALQPYHADVRVRFGKLLQHTGRSRNGKKLDPDLHAIMATVGISLIMQMLQMEKPSWRDALGIYQNMKLYKMHPLDGMKIPDMDSPDDGTFLGFTPTRVIMVCAEVLLRNCLVENAVAILQEHGIYSRNYQFFHDEEDESIRANLIGQLLKEAVNAKQPVIAKKVFLDLLEMQGNSSEPVDLKGHFNMIVTSLLSMARCKKDAIELYNRSAEYVYSIEQITFRSLLVGMVMQNDIRGALKLYNVAAMDNVYNLVMVDKLPRTIKIRSYWTMEEIHITILSYMRAMVDDEEIARLLIEDETRPENFRVMVNFERLEAPKTPADCIEPPFLRNADITVDGVRQRLKQVLRSKLKPLTLRDSSDAQYNKWKSRVLELEPRTVVFYLTSLAHSSVS